MSPLRILLTNITLKSSSGTEMYTYDLARRLLSFGHTPIVYSPELGALAQRLIEQSIPVVDRLEHMADSPDVIHGHHSLETMAALLTFPRVPGIFVCHDCSAWHDRPPCFPRLRRYVAVDQPCRDRLTLRDGIPPERVVVLQNGVDLQRFRPRGPLPERAQRALLLSNYADARTSALVGAACDAAGIRLDCAGRSLENHWDRPEERLPQYDLVFAKGRCAWEALAVGAAVVVCDAAGSGPLVTLDRLDELAGCNFGRRLLHGPLDRNCLIHEIRRYDASVAAEVSRRVRARADLDVVAGQLIELYHQVREEQAADETSLADESRAAAEFLGWWSAERQRLVREQVRDQVREQVARRRPGAILGRLWRSLRKRIDRVPWRRCAV